MKITKNQATQPTTLYKICNDEPTPKIVPFVVYGHRPENGSCRGDVGKFLVEDEFCKGQFVWKRPCHSVFFTRAEAKAHLVKDAKRNLKQAEQYLRSHLESEARYRESVKAAKTKLAAVEKIKASTAAQGEK